jgi:hypothetical protein
MIIVGPGIPPAMQQFAQEVAAAILALQQPLAPMPLCPVVSTAMPMADAYPQTLVLVTDLNILAHSDGSDWIRSDTGAPI